MHRIEGIKAILERLAAATFFAVIQPYKYERQHRKALCRKVERHLTQCQRNSATH